MTKYTDAERRRLIAETVTPSPRGRGLTLTPKITVFPEGLVVISVPGAPSLMNNDAAEAIKQLGLVLGDVCVAAAATTSA